MPGPHFVLVRKNTVCIITRLCQSIAKLAVQQNKTEEPFENNLSHNSTCMLKISRYHDLKFLFIVQIIIIIIIIIIITLLLIIIMNNNH